MLASGTVGIARASGPYPARTVSRSQVKLLTVAQVRSHLVRTSDLAGSQVINLTAEVGSMVPALQLDLPTCGNPQNSFNEQGYYGWRFAESGVSAGAATGAEAITEVAIVANEVSRTDDQRSVKQLISTDHKVLQQCPSSESKPELNPECAYTDTESFSDQSVNKAGWSGFESVFTSTYSPACGGAASQASYYYFVLRPKSYILGEFDFSFNNVSPDGSYQKLAQTQLLRLLKRLPDTTA